MKRPHIVERIRKAMATFNPGCHTILYGSEARGDARPDSDIDLLILVEGEKLSMDDQKKITNPIYDIELDTGISISTLVMLRKAWENRPFKTPFAINVEREGILL